MAKDLNCKQMWLTTGDRDRDNCVYLYGLSGSPTSDSLHRSLEACCMMWMHLTFIRTCNIFRVFIVYY